MRLLPFLALLLLLQSGNVWGWHCPYDEEAQAIMDACLDEGRSWAVCRAAAGLGPGHHTEDYADNSGDCDGSIPRTAEPVHKHRPLATLENPWFGSIQSGISVLSGWACSDEEIVVEINGEPYKVLHGMERPDTEEMCNDTDNGFGLLFNWNRLGDGRHEAVLFVGGREAARHPFRVTTFGQEYVWAPHRPRCTVQDFPSPGETTILRWQNSTQNFMVYEVR